MYDVIGDVHGHADELKRLLEKMDYDRRAGYFAHPRRKAVFVGDLIDRGPKILEVLEIVRAMVENKSALAVMGNHEFNAIAYHTRCSRSEDGFLREHNPKNIDQHGQTLDQIPERLFVSWKEWFRELPLWLELEGIRIIHACWSPTSMPIIKRALKVHGGVTDSFMESACTKGTDLFHAVEFVLKGKEVTLPGGASFPDGANIPRREARVQWYRSPMDGEGIDRYALPPDCRFPAEPPVREFIESEVEPYPLEESPVFFGHYWLTGDSPSLCKENVACLDYGVGRGGMLCAYRWNGERTLDQSGFVF